MYRFLFAVVLALMASIITGCAAQPVDVVAVHVGSDEQVLKVVIADDTCRSDHTIQVAETSSEVVITVTLQEDHTDIDCLDHIMAMLSQPLGDRSVINGATNLPIEVIRLSDSG